jgi:putative phosphoesterase
MSEHTIGVISDTHGLLRAEAVRALSGSSRIIHAGDVGDPAILDDLRVVAPVTAVRGNVDRGLWARSLAETEAVTFGSVSVYVLHDIQQLDLDARAAGVRVVISGHSHRPSLEERNGVLFLNPGSAGPRRFDLPVTLARMQIVDDAVDVRFVELLK